MPKFINVRTKDVPSDIKLKQNILQILTAKLQRNHQKRDNYKTE
ncbi:MAG: hypothetical protein QXN63_05520 [Candidatus Bathyarchaeia archaeon]